MYTYTFNLTNKKKWFIFINRVTDPNAFEFAIGRLRMFIKSVAKAKFSVFIWINPRLLMENWADMMLVVTTLKRLPYELMLAILHTPTQQARTQRIGSTGFVRWHWQYKNRKTNWTKTMRQAFKFLWLESVYNVQVSTLWLDFDRMRNKMACECYSCDEVC